MSATNKIRNKELATNKRYCMKGLKTRPNAWILHQMKLDQRLNSNRYSYWMLRLKSTRRESLNISFWEKVMMKRRHLRLSYFLFLLRNDPKTNYYVNQTRSFTKLEISKDGILRGNTLKERRNLKNQMQTFSSRLKVITGTQMLSPRWEVLQRQKLLDILKENLKLMSMILMKSCDQILPLGSLMKIRI